MKVFCTLQPEGLFITPLILIEQHIEKDPAYDEAELDIFKNFLFALNCEIKEDKLIFYRILNDIKLLEFELKLNKRLVPGLVKRIVLEAHIYINDLEGVSESSYLQIEYPSKLIKETAKPFLHLKDKNGNYLTQYDINLLKTTQTGFSKSL